MWTYELLDWLRRRLHGPASAASPKAASRAQAVRRARLALVTQFPSEGNVVFVFKQQTTGRLTRESGAPAQR